MNRPSATLLFLAAAIGFSPVTTRAEDAATPTFDDVRTVLKKRCTNCHNTDRARGDLDLSSIDGVQAGSASGPVVFAGKPEESLLFTLAAHQEDPKMPPGAPRIPQRELDVIRNWITHGLNDSPAKSMDKPKVVLAAVKPPSPIPAKATLPPANGITPWPQPAALTALAASPKARLVAIAGIEQVVLYDDITQAPRRALPFPEGQVFFLKFVDDGKTLLAAGGVGAESGKVVAFDIATGQRKFTVGDETDVILAADLSPDGSLVATGGPTRAVKIYSTADGQVRNTFTKHTDWVLSLAFSPDGLLLASGDRFGGVLTWEVGSGELFETLRGHTGPVHALDWPQSSDELVTAGDDGTVRLWNMHTGEVSHVSDPKLGPILSLTRDQAGRWLAGGRNKAVAILNADLNPAHVIPFDEGISRLALAPTGDQLIAAGVNGQTTVVRLDQPDVRTPLPLPIAPREPAAVAILRRSQLKPAAIAISETTEDSPTAAPASSTTTSPNVAVADPLSEARQAADLAEASVKATEAALATQRAVAERLRAQVRQLEEAQTVRPTP